MDANDHLLGLGKIASNLHGLEILLRVFLCEATNQKFIFPKAGDAALPNSHLTNYDSLGDLVIDYNGALSASEKHLNVDPSVVDTRDALAHGRLMSPGTLFPDTALSIW